MLRVWDLESSQSICKLEGHLGSVNPLAVTPGRRRAISASNDHTLRVWEVESGICITAFTGDGPVLRCAVASGGQTIVAKVKSGREHYLRVEELH
jgi:WD40 repeat protein